MSTIKPITHREINPSIHTYYVGWSAEELEAYGNQYQTQYYGSLQDARFEITDNQGNISYVIFRAPEIDESFKASTSQDFLLFKDNNRVLLNITGKLYRFLINEKKALDDSCYQGIIGNDFDDIASYYFHSLVSPSHELMIVVDCEGIAALTWDRILWKHDFERAASGYLNLLSISGDDVAAKYESPGNPDCLLSFNLQTGEEKCEII